METRHDIGTHREAALRRLIYSPRHSWLGLHAEYEAARDLAGSILDDEGAEVRLTMQRLTPLVRRLAHLTDEPPGPNRAQRRAAVAKARRGA